MHIKSAMIAVASVLCTVTNVAFADAQCTENIVEIKVYANGAIMFRTDGTCTYCQVGGSTDAIVSRGYSVLLTAKAMGKPVQFYWPNINDCSTQNQAYAVPTFIDFAN